MSPSDVHDDLLALKLIQRIQGRNSTAAVVDFVERASRLRPCALRGRLAPVDALALAVSGGSALAQLWHSHNEAMLLRHGYDTLVLLQQPHNQASGAWATEIWDVRHGRAVAARLRRAVQGRRPCQAGDHEAGDRHLRRHVLLSAFAAWSSLRRWAQGAL